LSLRPWKRHLMLFLTLGPISLLVVVVQPHERHANRTASVLEWYDRHTEFNIWFKRRSLTYSLFVTIKPKH